jgi:diguanylate cyclase (GGDEF)-like protein
MDNQRTRQASLQPADTHSHAGNNLRVLLIEDSAADGELAVRRLRQAGYLCSARRVVTEDEMRAALRAELPDLILSDFTMPQFDGMSALAVARAESPGVPFIFLSGTIGEERAIEALKCGAVDYILKSNPQRFATAVRRALEEAELRRTAQLAEQQVARLRGVLQMLSGVNSALVRIRDRDEVLKETCRLAHRVGGYAAAMVALINPTTRTARPAGWAGHEFLADPGRDFPVAAHETGDTSLMGRVMRTGDAILCEDVASFEHTISEREGLLAGGVHSLACLPLHVDNTPVGAFLFGASAAGVIGQDELLLLQELAANLSFALQYLDKQDAVRFLSYFEPLTGLAKRALFCERLNRVLTRSTERLQRLAVTVFDIDHLSVVNDSMGWHGGDRFLQCVADRLKGHFPETEQLAHLGGGTFACLHVLPAPCESEIDTLQAEIAQLFDRPFDVDGRTVVATVKCGFAYYPEDGAEPNQLVLNAEAALKEAKTRGERFLHHSIEMNSELARRVSLENRLRRALEERQFVLHYQPKIELRTARVVGVEALLRWQDPEEGLISPASFLPLLESAGLMTATGAWVLEQAAADCREWRRKGLPPIRVAVNISPSQLRNSNIAGSILERIGDLAGDNSWGIDLEITEGALSGDSSSCVQALRVLRAAGIRVAIDDFGTGFSSLGRLSELPIDTLKIDRSFTSRLPSDRKCRTLVSTIISLAHAFDLTTVAEGVESQAHLDYLLRDGCDEAQGYLHSRPIPKAELEAWLCRQAEPASRESEPGLRMKSRTAAGPALKLLQRSDATSGGQTTVIQRILDRTIQRPGTRDAATTGTVAVLVRAMNPPRALVAITNERLRHQIAERITPDMLDCEYADDQQQVVQRYGTGFCPVVITDSLELIHKLRLMATARAPFILYAAGLDAAAERESALLAGADDCVAGEAHERELDARLGAARRVAELEAALRVTVAENRKLSAIDDLTRLATRRFFAKHFPREVERSARYGHALSLILCDIDHFKNINDTLGHSAGDQVLRQFGRRLQHALRRRVDWVARIGGEEFAVVLPETAYEPALNVARKLRECIANSAFKVEQRSLQITASFGLCAADKVPLGGRRLAQRMLKEADTGLYRSKNDGRNRVTATLLPVPSADENGSEQKLLGTESNSSQNPTGRPVSDDRGNQTWEWALDGEFDSERLKALTEGMTVADAAPQEARAKGAGLDPYNKHLGAAVPVADTESRRRTLDDMRRLSDEIKRKRTEKKR